MYVDNLHGDGFVSVQYPTPAVCRRAGYEGMESVLCTFYREKDASVRWRSYT